jgi:hypothetical protein
MDSRKIEDLKKELEKINGILSELGVSRDIIERKVKTFGNGAHIVLPKQHVNKNVKIIVE